MSARSALAMVAGLAAAGLLAGCTLTPIDPPPADPTRPVTPVPPTPPPPQPPPPPPPTFSYVVPGALEPSTGQGVGDRTVYAPNMVFPIGGEFQAFLNSQVHRPGGQIPGDQCSELNYSYPWRDNFCENRSANRKTLNCPTPRVHQGQDIRAGSVAMCNSLRRTPAADRVQIPVVATADGLISYIGSYSVHLRTDREIFRYLHLNMAKLEVAEGDAVTAGQTIGYFSNDFGGTPTTLHMHFELQQNIDGVGWTWVSPYMSLVEAYGRKKGGPGRAITAEEADEMTAVAIVSLPVLPASQLEAFEIPD